MFARYRSTAAVATAHFEHGAVFPPLLAHDLFGDAAVAAFRALDIPALAVLLEMQLRQGCVTTDQNKMDEPEKSFKWVCEMRKREQWRDFVRQRVNMWFYFIEESKN